MNKLPILISVPHCGRVVPEAVKDIFNLSADETIEDGDEGADEI